jgi:hypothetical protein
LHYQEFKIKELWQLGKDEKCILTLIRKPEGKRPHGIPARRQVSNSKMDLKEIAREGVK